MDYREDGTGFVVFNGGDRVMYLEKRFGWSTPLVRDLVLQLNRADTSYIAGYTKGYDDGRQDWEESGKEMRYRGIAKQHVGVL